jgi:curli biogenesis system outer membrane secretion channel CsgG
MKPAPPESTPVDRRKLVTMTFAALAVALIAGVGAWRMFVPAAAPSPTTAEERLAASGIRIVAVAPAGAEAAAGSRLSPQRLQALGEMIRQKLEQRLAGEPDIKVAERARLDAVFRERNFSAANPANMAAGAKAIGASVLVAPALVDLDTRSQTFSGYGVSTSRTTVTASILIRLIDVPTSTIKYSATFQGRAVRESSTFSPETGGDAESEAIRDAIGKACADPSFVKAVKS